jgi:hypothetical protein
MMRTPNFNVGLDKAQFLEQIIEINPSLFDIVTCFLIQKFVRKDVNNEASLLEQGGPKLTCSIIGSFRKHYGEVALLIEAFESCNVQVLSPKRSSIVNPLEKFVRLQTDNPRFEPVEIQLIALHRILRSSFVYVLCPAGYVGKTTCYEIGRIHERGIPLYFSERPDDLPIAVPVSTISNPEKIVQYLAQHKTVPPIIATEIPENVRVLQSRLQREEYVE